MKTLKNKMKNKKGFTLMEMLIVVAIMVVLIAVSIPVFSSQLNKAKTTADDANVRAAKAAVLTLFMMGGDVYDGDATPTTVGVGATGSYKYDASAGILTTSTVTVTGYGQSSDEDDKAAEGSEVPSGCWLLLTVDESGNVTYIWDK